MASYLPIEDYAIIGDLHTVALVGKNGSIDWCCFPRFDAPSVFAALLDHNKGGFFRIAPHARPDIRCTQLYLSETNVLLTRFADSDGVGEITDFMPVKQEKQEKLPQQIVRSVAVIHGSLTFELLCCPAFNYARDAHKVEITEEGAVFQGMDQHLGLSSPVPLTRTENGGVRAIFTLHAGQGVHFMLESDGEILSPLNEEAYQTLFQQTLNFWRHWIGQCRYHGRWREMVQRSALALKLLTYQPTGAIVAAPTMGLPECIGGERNWDYRYTWLRDAAFTLDSLLNLGFTEEAEAFMQWLDARCHKQDEQKAFQIVYKIDGGCDLPETNLSHLEGYKQSQPVRLGNAAAKQEQLGIYGEVMDAVYIFNRYSTISYDLWENLCQLLEWLNKHWQDPDDSIWEVRGGAQRFVFSRLMSWVAFDRAVRVARERGLPAPIDEWTQASARIYREIMTKGWNEQKQSFIQHYGSDALDASVLLMGQTKFTGAREPRMRSTIAAIQRELSTGALVYRYKPQGAAKDGLKGNEGTFAACGFWLAEALVRSGQIEQGRLHLEKMLSYSNHVGLYAEEIGPAGEALGNYPQAFTHLSLIIACRNVDQALNEGGIKA